MTAPLAITPARRAKLSSRTIARVGQGHAVFKAISNATREDAAVLAMAANTFVALVVDDLKRDLKVRCDISAYIKTATTAVQTGAL
jgi:hypothetical protein